MWAWSGCAERVKVLQQISKSEAGYGTVRSALSKMYREEGLAGGWKGNGTNVARIAPYSAIQFCFFDIFKRYIMPEERHEASTWRLLTCGGLSGMCSSFVCYPLDLVRSILTVQTTTQQYKGIVCLLAGAKDRVGPVAPRPFIARLSSGCVLGKRKWCDGCH